jgi:citronellol/citronellal dehydrogenase
MAGEDNEKVAIVAGAGSGIGQGCALRLARMGYRVIALGRTEAKLNETVDQIARTGGRAAVFVADVRDWDRLAELQATVDSEGVDIVVNSAGGQFHAYANAISRGGWQAVVDTNLSGSFFLCRQLYPSLLKRKGSVVTVIANIWQRAAPMAAHSGAARAGIVSLTRTLALEWASDGIRVNAVSPGVTDTRAFREYGHDAKFIDSIPLRRMATVDEVVDAILFMGLSTYTTGEVLTIDGGLQLR